MSSDNQLITHTTASSLRAALVGAWKLESYMSLAVAPSNARPVYPMTKSVQGMILYTPDGYMSAQMLIPGQPRFEISKAREAEWAECGKRYFAYSGPYYVSEDGGKVRLRHGMKISNRPDMVGEIQLRDWRFEDEGKLLILGNDEPTEVKVRQRVSMSTAHQKLTWF